MFVLPAGSASHVTVIVEPAVHSLSKKAESLVVSVGLKYICFLRVPVRYTVMLLLSYAIAILRVPDARKPPDGRLTSDFKALIQVK